MGSGNPSRGTERVYRGTSERERTQSDREYFKRGKTEVATQRRGNILRGGESGNSEVWGNS